jgi:hypothetical protein
MRSTDNAKGQLNTYESAWALTQELSHPNQFPSKYFPAI